MCWYRYIVRALLLVVAWSELQREAIFIQIFPLSDHRLCNNAHSSHHGSKQCYQQTGPCDDRSISSSDCQELLIKLINFTSDALTQLVPTVDSDLSIRRIRIKLTTPMQLIDYNQLGNEIDRFLLTRPWWYVSKEPYAWHEHPHTSNLIIIDRVQHGIEKRMLFWSLHQYPPQHVCESTPMLLGTFDTEHPGWGSVCEMYHSAQLDLKQGITAIYVSHKNDPLDNTGFITGSDCPHTLNKWECAFLAPTNCSIPAIVTNCTSYNCVSSGLPTTFYYSIVFDSSSVDAMSYQSGSKRFGHLLSSNDKYVPRIYHESFSAAFDEPLMKHVKPYSDVVEQIPINNNVNSFYRLIFRQSYFYRSTIHQILHRFYQNNRFTPKADRCVAAHIRRGDRTAQVDGIPVANITQYCYDNARYVGEIEDFGCFSTPFASVTLGHVLDSAAKLVPPEVRTLILASDDEAWMVSEIEAMRQARPEWKVYFLEAPKPENHDKKSSEEKYNYMRSKGGTASGTFWWGSIELARQCEGFVGHFGSGATMFFHYELCEHHLDFENTCPASFDVRTIPELQTHLSHD